MIRDPLGPFRKVGKWTYFLRDIGRAIPDFKTYASETIRQMRNIGVDSLPLAAIVAAFIGVMDHGNRILPHGVARPLDPGDEDKSACRAPTLDGLHARSS